LSEELQQVTETAQESLPQAETQEVTETTASPEQSEPTEKPRGGFQRRIDELTSRYHQEKAEKQQLLDIIKSQTQVRTQEPKAESEQAPRIADYERYEDYLKAEAKYEARQEIRSIRAEEERQRHQAETQRREQETQAQRESRIRETTSKWQSMVQEAEKKYPDYYDVVHAPDVYISEPMAEAIIEAGKTGQEMAYYLGKNKSEAARIAQLSPVLGNGTLRNKITKNKITSASPN
jgi:hypothetical protein